MIFLQSQQMKWSILYICLNTIHTHVQHFCTISLKKNLNFILPFMQSLSNLQNTFWLYHLIQNFSLLLNKTGCSCHSNCFNKKIKPNPDQNFFFKSRVRETPTLLACADNSTDTMKFRFFFALFCSFGYITTTKKLIFCDFSGIFFLQKACVICHQITFHM